jgi:hypothetical protein
LVKLKLSSFILGLYIVILIGLPCVDNDTNNCSDYISVNTKNSENSHNHDIDLCSPFCVCECCSTVFEVSTENIELFVRTFKFENITFYQTKKVSLIAQVIWQPPKI